MSLDARVETYMTMDLCGRKALFSNSRIDRDTVPKGLFVYDLREGIPLDDHNEFGEPIPPTLSIAKSVWCDHFGTALLRSPILEAEKGEFEIGEDDWGFWGDEFPLHKGIQWLSREKPSTALNANP